LVYAFIIVVLSLNYKSFNRASDPINVKKGFVVVSISFILVLLNASLDIFILKNQYKNIHGFSDAFIKSIKLLFYMDTVILEPKTKIAKIYGDSIITVNWVCILSAVFLLLKPIVYKSIVVKFEKKKIRNYLLKYGHNPISYLSIEDDKKYYFSSDLEGFIAYKVCAGVAVCLGDPVCDKKDVMMLLGEFTVFCKENELGICFCSVTKEFLYEFEKLGYKFIKLGEEAMFKLDSYEISGKKGAKIRASINHATKKGISILEYKPLLEKNKNIEEQLTDISKEWLKMKKSSELSFTLGSLSLESPMDRRYFIAIDENGKIQGFVVFVPFLKNKGYYADVTRRRKEAPRGIMEKITITAFETMKLEGVEWGSLGMAPLANVKETKNGITANILDFVYEHMNQFYGFKSLYQYKKKYFPTHWEPRFFIYYSSVLTPKIIYAMLKAQNPKGIRDFVLSKIKTSVSDFNNI